VYRLMARLTRHRMRRMVEIPPTGRLNLGSASIEPASSGEWASGGMVWLGYQRSKRVSSRSRYADSKEARTFEVFDLEPEVRILHLDVDLSLQDDSILTCVSFVRWLVLIKSRRFGWQMPLCQNLTFRQWVAFRPLPCNGLCLSAATFGAPPQTARRITYPVQTAVGDASRCVDCRTSLTAIYAGRLHTAALSLR
jgi:hypothetical protein